MEEARERFFKKVNKTDTCWLWTACILHGYGTFGYKYKVVKAHRFSWFLAGNTIPEGHLIRHKCRNRHCVNPDHLETGTHQENALDRVRDMSLAQGNTHGQAKLTEEQVRDIRANRDNKTVIELAKEYNVIRNNIYLIITRKTWQHLE